MIPVGTIGIHHAPGSFAHGSFSIGGTDCLASLNSSASPSIVFLLEVSSEKVGRRSERRVVQENDDHRQDLPPFSLSHWFEECSSVVDALRSWTLAF